MLNKKNILLFILFAFSTFVSAQYYVIGQDPASVKWMQIKTGNFTIIFPKGFENNAQKLANTFAVVHEKASATIGMPPKKMPIVIHNRSVSSNAFSLWAPKRIEFYSCPPQDNYAQDWLDQLAIHEYRHAAQINTLNTGFTKALSWLFGEQISATSLGLFVPSWLMEGDAVATETALSYSGRGRIPSFEMRIRAQILEEGLYS
ncbi:MAG: hypothetical protein WCJ74_02860, partial [bacterium]